MFGVCGMPGARVPSLRLISQFPHEYTLLASCLQTRTFWLPQGKLSQGHTAGNDALETLRGPPKFISAPNLRMWLVYLLTGSLQVRLVKIRSYLTLNSMTNSCKDRQTCRTQRDKEELRGAQPCDDTGGGGGDATTKETTQEASFFRARVAQ